MLYVQVLRSTFQEQRLVQLFAPKAEKIGSRWTRFHRRLAALGFALAGDLGVAIGISEFPDPMSTVSISTNQGKTWVDLIKNLDGLPMQILVPSANVAYILCSGDKLIKYSLE